MSLVQTFSTSITPYDFDISGGYLYAINTSTSNIVKYNYPAGGTPVSSNLVGTLNYPYRMRCYGNNLYITESGGVVIYPNTGGTRNTISVGGTVGLYIYNSIIYVGTYATSKHIYAYNVSNSLPVSGFTTTNLGAGTQIMDLTVANNIIYAADNGNNRISTVNATTGAIINANFITGITKPSAVEISGNNLYVGFGIQFGGGGNIYVYNATTGSLINNTYYTGGGLNSSIRMYNNLLYFGTGSDILFYSQYQPPPPPPPPYPCFRQGAKILRLNQETDGEEYVPVETLMRGDLIVTSESGYKCIHSIGHKSIPNPKSDTNPSNRLYKFSNQNCKEIFEPLYITGEHCTLHKTVMPELKSKIAEHMGDVYITENHYRVPAMLDDRAESYDGEDEPATIWHFALENEHPLYNYGVYANGLLVESCSIWYLHEKSGMEII